MALEQTPALHLSDFPDSLKTLCDVPPKCARSESGSDICVREVGQPRREWVPNPESKKRARTLVICFDGTGDQYDDYNSNIVQLVSCLKKDNQNHQLVYYQAGIGTYTNSAFVTSATIQASKVLDSMFAWNLPYHVQGGYEFLMQNYTEGDKIAIFGFSRGAYQARALAGMIQKVGLLPPFNHAQIPFAWKMYIREDKDGLEASVGFKKAFCTDVTIDFIGVWDTVASVGIMDKEFPFVSTNSAIRVFRHALALDEHRAKFMPNFYHYLHPYDVDNAAKRPTLSERQSSELWQAKVNEENGRRTDALEVWFAGCHCDVGGGSVRNGTRNSLNRIPLRWMIRQCFETNTGIIFDKDMLKSMVGIDADMLYPEVKPRPPRLPPPQDASIADRVRQPLPILVFAKAIGGLLMFPISLVARVAVQPLNHLWLLVRFSDTGKWIRGISRRRNIQPKAIQGPTPSSIQQEVPFDSEETEEMNDALSPEYDQLSLVWFWWIIECIPFRFREQKGMRDDFFVRINRGRGRKIYGDARRERLKVHRSVKTRLEILDESGKSVYRPRAWFNVKKDVDDTTVRPGSWNVENPDQWEWVD